MAFCLGAAFISSGGEQFPTSLRVPKLRPLPLSFGNVMQTSTKGWWIDSDGGKTEVLGEEPVPVPLCPPQTPRGPGMEPGPRGERPATYRLRLGTTFFFFFVLCQWGRRNHRLVHRSLSRLFEPNPVSVPPFTSRGAPRQNAVRDLY
jgi:hypothetical protein